MEIREDLHENVRLYVEELYPEDDPTPQVDFGLDREKEEADQLAQRKIPDDAWELRHQKRKAFIALARKRDRGGTKKKFLQMRTKSYTLMRKQLKKLMRFTLQNKRRSTYKGCCSKRVCINLTV